ncbi:MAG: class I SAM-dependent methyltransferase [Balneolaceae bacterium]|nr:class I SAM-dependent methyltransferase [Balneolaceae bacterium]
MINCTLCKSPDTDHLHTNNLYNYLICRHCDLVFVKPGERPAPEEEKKRYDQHENNPEDERYRNFLSQLFDPLKEKLEPNSYGLDYGSGPGPTLSIMLEEVGHSMEIYDPYYAKNESVLQNKYDFITSTETVEHFYNPAEEFEKLWPMLKPGGYFGIMTLLRPEDEPFSEWHYTYDETHVSFYSRKTFRWLADQLNAELSFEGNRVIILQKSL